MYELHENEQYFFTQETLDTLCVFLWQYDFVCCLCAPLLGKKLAEEGREVRILDIDDRFKDIWGYRYFDLHRPEWLGEKYNLIICDPPFFNVSLSCLFAAIRILSQNDFNQPILISYLQRRANNILGTFSKFGIAETDYFPSYQTVKNCQRNDIRFFSNIPDEINAGLS